jgi:ABC-type multidrug transport system permease subunit
MGERESKNWELQLQPTDPETDAARQMIKESELPFREPAQEIPEPRWQFGILHLIFATTLFAIAAALLQWFAPSLLAGTIGLLALIVLIIRGVVQIRSREFEIFFWSAIVLYLAYSVIAALAG